MKQFTAGLLIGMAPGLFFAAVPHAQAETTAVFLGGTGTGYVPSGSTPPKAFITPFVPGAYVGINHVYDGAPTTTPQSQVPGLAALVAAEQARGNAVTVIGLSKGAQVAQASMHDGTAPAPGTVAYVLIGNPDRDGGMNTALGFRPAQGEVRFNVRNVYAEYDGFADYPDRPDNALAVANALAAIVFIHPYYGTGKAADPLKNLDKGITTVTDNLDAEGKPNGTTTTETRIPTKNLPLTQALRDTLKTWHQSTKPVDALDAKLRPQIDKGYSRNDKPTTSATTPAKAPKPKASNPVRDTVKTVQGALRNTAKTWAPKKPKATTTTKEK